MTFRSTISVFMILLFCSLSLAQEVYVGAQTGLFVGSSSTIFSGGDLQMAGTLDNQGTLLLNSNVDFRNNTAIGDLVFLGKAPQKISGNTLQARSLTLQDANTVNLEATQLLSSTLHLNKGILKSTRPGSLVILEGQEVTGGSVDSYVEGTLQMQSIAETPLRFPVGLEGNYDELTLERSQVGSMVEVTAFKPFEALIPNDSLVGISEEIVWKIRQSGDEFRSAVTMAFEGVDLDQIPNYHEIRASSYKPVPARKLEGEPYYAPLGLAQNNQASARNAGRLTSAQTVTLNDQPVYLAIGLMPEGGPYIYVPNAFAPGGIYEENQVFRPFLEGAEVYSLDMTIWDRFNNEVYSESISGSDLTQTGWDGTFNGQDAPEALYYYKISMETAIGDFAENGTVVLLR